MYDVFLSYSREDRNRAQMLAQALHQHGISVWWDQRILPGNNWHKDIEKQIRACRTVVVLWTHTSVTSDWVRTEASEGADRGILLPVLWHEVEPPLRFKMYQFADFRTWRGELQGPAIVTLVAAIRQKVASGGGKAKPPPGPSSGGRPSPTAGVTVPAARASRGQSDGWIRVGVLALILATTGLLWFIHDLNRIHNGAFYTQNNFVHVGGAHFFYVIMTAAMLPMVAAVLTNNVRHAVALPLLANLPPDYYHAAAHHNGVTNFVGVVGFAVVLVLLSIPGILIARNRRRRKGYVIGFTG